MDLFHRLNTFVIHVPPLRDRREDIPLLFEHFLNYFAGRLGKEIGHVHKALAEALHRYDFPGNVRELKHLTERAVILCEGEELTLDHFDNLNYRVRAAQIHAAPPRVMKLDHLEKENIEKALKATNYKKSKAAQLLNISRQALDRKLAKYNIEV
jgi:DNA-binding NtrC family response regulator